MKLAGDTALIVDGDKVVDALDRTPAERPADAEDVSTSNSLRLAIEETIALLELASPDRALRLEAVKRLQNAEFDEPRLALLAKAEQKERDAGVRDTLRQMRALGELQSPDRALRLSAAQALRTTISGRVREALKTRLATEEDGELRVALTRSLRNVEFEPRRRRKSRRRLFGTEPRQHIAARRARPRHHLRADGRDQYGAWRDDDDRRLCDLCRAKSLPRASARLFPMYLAAAAPAAFIVAALVGVAIERTVIRFLYGRALETLLATWGVSLILMQAVRSLFGAQNVQVENPAWMSGRVFVTDNLELPYNRIVIIVFSVGVLLLVSYLLARTRLGLFVRAVTQNRGMARCVGVDSSRIDTMAFALGSGLAGLAGVALSQVGNVGPDLGQHYIVDSFMVVVLGGVGQLAGAVYAALGLGVAGKILENMSGAVLAEIALLIFIVVFIQKRPQGLFALGGRQAD